MAQLRMLAVTYVNFFIGHEYEDSYNMRVLIVTFCECEVQCNTEGFYFGSLWVHKEETHKKCQQV